VLLQVDGAGVTDELLSDLCMHITAMKPLSLCREDVDAALIAKEREIATELVKTSGKPENMIPKIVDGKMNRWFSERILLEQEFANADKFKGTIQQYLKKFGDVKIVAYRRLEVGE
jgi:elongation factor Ts